MKDDNKTKKQLLQELVELRLQNATVKKSENSEKYRSLVEDLRDVIYELDSQGVVLYISPTVRDLLGYDSTEIVGKNFTELAHKDDLSRQAEWFSELRKGVESPYIHRIINKTGEYRWAQMRIKPIMEGGQFKGARGIIIDVTEQKRAEEALRESEEKYRHVFENSIMGISQTLRGGRLIAANNAYAKMYGYANAEEMMTELSSVGPLYANPEEREDVLRILAEKGVMEPREITVIRRDGTRFTVLVGAREIRDSKGNPLYYQSELIDISERKRAEDALRESEELFRSYLEYAPDGIYMTDLEGNFLYGNLKCEAISGYRREELLGKNFLELNLLPEKSLNKAAQLLQANIEGKSTGPDEVELISKEGRIIPVEISTSLVQQMGQTIVLSSVRDITERKRAEEKLKDTLVSLRNALNTTIQVMVSAVEARDPYTSGHQTRSADLARAIAMEMGLPQDKIDGIRVAGSIHDIGKISIPAEILSKPTKLSEIEFSLIKEHARKGYEMLQDVESPWPLAQIVYQHHERMNGSGYPRNLKGEEILIEARILSVADVVEAIASHRPYRPGLGIDAALAEIEKNKGIFYDDAVADACLRLFREKGFELAVA